MFHVAPKTASGVIVTKHYETLMHSYESVYSSNSVIHSSEIHQYRVKLKNLSNGLWSIIIVKACPISLSCSCLASRGPSHNSLIVSNLIWESSTPVPSVFLVIHVYMLLPSPSSSAWRHSIIVSIPSAGIVTPSWFPIMSFIG